MLRAKTNDGVSFASVIEPHGDYNPTVEYTIGSHSQVGTHSVEVNGETVTWTGVYKLFHSDKHIEKKN